MNVIPGKGENVFHPTKQLLEKNTTILQKCFLDMFSFGPIEYQNMLNAKPGLEISKFNTILKNIKPITVRDDRGFSKTFTSPNTQIHSPDDFFRLAVIRYLAIAYERASRRDSELRKAIMSLDTERTKVYFIDSKKDKKTSFIYDGYQGKDGITLFESPMMIVFSALQRAKDAIGKSVTIGLDAITPSQVQSKIIRDLEKVLQLEYKDGDMILNKDASIQDAFSLATQCNRSYIRATHPRMILPEKSSNKTVIQVERFGSKISFTTNVPDFTETSYVDDEPDTFVEYLKDDMETTPLRVSHYKEVSGYELKTSLIFGKKRYELMPLSS